MNGTAARRCVRRGSYRARARSHWAFRWPRRAGHARPDHWKGWNGGRDDGRAGAAEEEIVFFFLPSDTAQCSQTSADTESFRAVRRVTVI